MKVRFGIIGLGGIANRFASVLNTDEGIELYAVARVRRAHAPVGPGLTDQVDEPKWWTVYESHSATV